MKWLFEMKRGTLLLELLQMSLIKRDKLSCVPSVEEWNGMYELARLHGVAGFLFGGIERLPKEQQPQRKLLMMWFGLAEHYRRVYAKQRQAVKSLNELWGAQGLRIVELKGDAIGRLYPKPELRYSCDYDCLLSDYEEGNRIVERQGVKVNREFYKNSSFVWDGLHVENHQFCTPIRGNRAMKRFEKVLRQLLAKDKMTDFNALFLMEHMWAHFFEEALTLKQMTDWLVFYKEYKDAVDWSLFEAVAKDCGFWRFSITIIKIADNILSGSSDMSGLTAIEERLWLSIMQGGGEIGMNNGWNTRFQLVANYFRNGWKYKFYAPHGPIGSLVRTVIGFAFDRNPKL